MVSEGLKSQGGGLGVYGRCWAVLIHHCQKQRCPSKAHTLFWIDLKWLVIRYLLFYGWECSHDCGNICQNVTSQAHALHLTSTGLLMMKLSKSDFLFIFFIFLDNTSQNIFTASMRVREMHRLYFRLGVLSRWCCICSVETIFIVRFMNRNQPLNCRRAPASECTDFNFVADHLTWSRVVNDLDFPPWCWIAPMKTLLP